MIMPREDTCSECGKKYMAGCMIEIPSKCDDCRGITRRKEEKMSLEEWMAYILNRHGISVPEFTDEISGQSTRTKTKIATNVPEPPPISDATKEAMLAEARQWGAEAAQRSAAIEAVTSDDLRVRTR